MAVITRLRTRPDRMRQDEAEVLRQALLPFAAGALEPHVRALIGHIDRETAASNVWTFIMLSPDQNAAVVDWLSRHSSRPLVALRLWALLFAHLDRMTGEVLLTRDEIASAIGARVEHVSGVMSELVEIGAVSRRRERVAGMKGQGRVRYYLNPRVGTHLAGAERDAAQHAAPALRLV